MTEIELTQAKSNNIKSILLLELMVQQGLHLTSNINLQGTDNLWALTASGAKIMDL